MTYWLLDEQTCVALNGADLVAIDTADGGERWLRPGVRLARLQQTLPEGDDLSVYEVVAAGLADDLSGGEWTVFAPTDDAFAKLELTPDNVASAFSQEELVDILLYHVLVGSNSTAELKGMLGNVVMANGKQAGLKFYEDHVYVNDDSKVIVENVIADNGTIHAVDTVILPPWPRE